MNGKKNRLRSSFLRKRRQIPEEEKRRQSEEVLRQLGASLLFQNASFVLSFWPLPEEIDLSGVRALCEKRGKRLAYPRVSGENMDFFEVLRGEPLREGAFHVMEPEGIRPPVCWEEALCLVPGAVFDGYGNRFGYGKGYYDRYLKKHSGLLTVGVCFRQQLSEARLMADPEDVPVRYLLTETGIARSAILCS